MITPEYGEKLLKAITEWGDGATGDEVSDMFFKRYTDGPQGAKFELLKQPHHTQDDLRRAKNFLNVNYDVVSIRVIYESDLLNS